MNDYNYVIFFDAERQIFECDIKSEFLEYFLVETLPVESYAKKSYEKCMKSLKKNILKGATFSSLNKGYYKNFSGTPVKLINEIAQSWYYKAKLELKNALFNQKTIFEIDMHKRQNAQIVILSSLFSPCLEPFIEEFSIKYTICPNLEIINGYYTGNLLSDPVNIDGKSKAIENFLIKQYKSKDLSFQNQIDMPFCDIVYDKSNITYC